MQRIMLFIAMIAISLGSYSQSQKNIDLKEGDTIIVGKDKIITFPKKGKTLKRDNISSKQSQLRPEIIEIHVESPSNYNYPYPIYYPNDGCGSVNCQLHNTPKINNVSENLPVLVTYKEFMWTLLFIGILFLMILAIYFGILRPLIGPKYYDKSDYISPVNNYYMGGSANIHDMNSSSNNDSSRRAHYDDSKQDIQYNDYRETISEVDREALSKELENLQNKIINLNKPDNNVREGEDPIIH